MGTLSIWHWIIAVALPLSLILGIVRGVKNGSIANTILSAVIPIYGIIYFFAASRTGVSRTDQNYKIDFKQRGLADVKNQIHFSNFCPLKHKAAEQWVKKQESPWKQPGAIIGIAALILTAVGFWLKH